MKGSMTNMATNKPKEQLATEGFADEPSNPEYSERVRGEVVAQAQPSTVDLVGPLSAAHVSNEALKEMSFGELTTQLGFYDANEVVPTDQFGHVIENDEERNKLIKQPFLIVKWDFYDGDFGEFASARLITPDNERYILNDGSTGIYQQLKNLTDQSGMRGMLLVKKGLRVSVYDKEMPDGRVIRDARTYYLDVRL